MRSRRATDDYNQTNSYPVNGQPTAQKWDPRLFHTVAMPSFPYKYETDNIMTKENSRNPDTYGYYSSLKEVPQRSKGETYNGSWQAFAMNDYVFRYTDVMLMRAELRADKFIGSGRITNIAKE